MGADSSKSTQSLDQHLSLTERQQLEAVLKKLVDDKHRITTAKLQTLLGGKLSEDAIQRLFVFMHNIPNGAIKDKTYVSREQLVTCLVHTLKGSNEQMANILLCLASSNKLNDVSKLLSVLLRLCYESLFCTEAFKSWRFASDYTRERFCEYLIDDLGHKDLTTELSVDDVERWLNGSTSVPNILRRAFHRCFTVGDASEFPSIIPVCKLSANKQLRLAPTILDLSAVLFINSSIPHELRTEWRLLFDSRSQGESFSTMIRSVLDSGPTVIVIRDKDQHIFGGFASESWLSQAKFYGSSHSFLFSVSPVMCIYLPSGYNNNFMYLNQNQQTLPNGLGMGGQFGYFGLWLDQEYGTGHSRAQPKCTTYNSPQLSGSADFLIDVLEVWAVGPEKITIDDSEQDNQKEKKRGVFNMDIETKAILEMVDKGHHSEAIRDEDARMEEQAKRDTDHS